MTDNGQGRAEINHNVIETDVRALAINSTGEMFAGTAGAVKMAFTVRLTTATAGRLRTQA